MKKIKLKALVGINRGQFNKGDVFDWPEGLAKRLIQLGAAEKAPIYARKTPQPEPEIESKPFIGYREPVPPASIDVIVKPEPAPLIIEPVAEEPKAISKSKPRSKPKTRRGRKKKSES
jgi:hypothetical protein